MASVDDPETKKKFAEQHEADFPMLSDPDRKVATAYGVLSPPNPQRPDAQPRARRWTFYIGADGKVLAVDQKVQAAQHGEDIAKKLEELGVTKKG